MRQIVKSWHEAIIRRRWDTENDETDQAKIRHEIEKTKRDRELKNAKRERSKEPKLMKKLHRRSRKRALKALANDDCSSNHEQGGGDRYQTAEEDVVKCEEVNIECALLDEDVSMLIMFSGFH
ncbi:hypothetical protein DPMN_120939 [Dreissena polymorpha]|uniref:Uncharacterized protein n=1 Tax=Dreissena polymorpha TaxID=45954 RepID=A0A9D4GPL7_DREPO|nr:hypothetical protein DPMN_120939 [Dreissena polymorpha]